MANPGKYNTLSIKKILDFGVYLDGGESGEILLPMKWVPDNCRPDDTVEVFLYFDSEDRLIATTMKPYVQVGETALLKVKAASEVGAFLDWGLEKDLFVPHREQAAKMVEGRSYLVYVYTDPQNGRITASSKIERFLGLQPHSFQPGDEVDLTLWRTTDLGYLAIINNTHEGMLYANEVFEELDYGQKLKGYISKVREDGKIDLLLTKPGYEKIDELSERLLEILHENNGYLDLNDKSPAEEIYLICGMSKKNFKKSAGALFKKRIINIEDRGIRLV